MRAFKKPLPTARQTYPISPGQCARSERSLVQNKTRHDMHSSQRILIVAMDFL